MTPSGVPSSELELRPLTEGAVGWLDEGHRLVQVPEWMLGATLIRGVFGGPSAGTVVAVRPAAPSVVYAIVERDREGGPGQSGGLLPGVLPGAGWEPRSEAPAFRAGSTLAVFAKRVGGKEPLCLPPFGEPGAVFSLVVKVDVEAFEAGVETTGSLEYDRVPMTETVVAWSDRQSRYTWVPTNMASGRLFRGPHCATLPGTVVRIRASGAFRAYVIVEAEYKGGRPRTGGFLQSLPRDGWRSEGKGSPSWGDTASTMCVFSRKAADGVELMLPPTVGEVVFSVVVVDISGSSERLSEELKQAFKAWDPEGHGGILKVDLDSLLRALCPGLDARGREALLTKVDRYENGRIAYEEFIDRIMQ